MKTILIATDFSKASRHATNYGLKLARTINAKVVLLHAFQPLIGAIAFFTSLQLKELTIINLKEELKATGGTGDPNVSICSVESEPVNAILSIAKEINASYIITGVKKEVPAAGHIVAELMKQKDIPLIAVPENIEPGIPSEV